MVMEGRGVLILTRGMPWGNNNLHPVLRAPNILLDPPPANLLQVSEQFRETGTNSSVRLVLTVP